VSMLTISVISISSNEDNIHFEINLIALNHFPDKQLATNIQE